MVTLGSTVSFRQVNKIPAGDRAPPLRKGGFPLSDNFSVRKHVYLARVSKIETLYGRSSIYLKVEPRSTFTFTRGLLYIVSNSFTHVHFSYVKNYATVEINFNYRVIFT